MNLVNDKGAIQSLVFIFNEQKYKVIGTRVNRSIWDCVDIIKREDGMTKEFTRKELKNYFINVVFI